MRTRAALDLTSPLGFRPATLAGRGAAFVHPCTPEPHAREIGTAALQVPPGGDSRFSRAGLGLLLLCGLLAAACGRSAAARRKNVILICLDTVRADHLGCYGYEQRETTPNLDDLAKAGTVYEHASSTAGWTKPSVPSFLTGTYPMQHGVYLGSARDEAGVTSDVLPASADTLAEAFQAAGYQTAAFVKNSQLRAGLGFEQGFSHYVDEAGDAQEIRWKASDWLEQRDGDRPFFLYLHYLDAHWPYPVPDEYATRYVSPEMIEFVRSKGWKELRDAVNDGKATLPPEQIAALVALYDGSIAWLDHQLGLLFRKLEREGLAESTVVCVIADHGEEFLEHGKLGHGHGLWEGLLHVPWILRIPGRAAGRVETPVSLVDLYPTLLAAADVSPQHNPLGVDRVHDPLQQSSIFAEHLEPGSYQQALVRKGVKLQRWMRFTEAARRTPDGGPALQLSPGERLEAKYEPSQEGMRATRITRSSDPADDPIELKGLVESVGKEGLRIDGVEVRLDSTTELYGETTLADGKPRLLETGMMVKVRGEPAAGGALSALRIKLYPPSDEIEHELRGRLDEIAPDGSLLLGGLRLAVAESTDVSGVQRSGKRRMGRDDVARFLDAEAEGSLPEDYASSAEQRDLSQDPDESRAATPTTSTDGLRQISSALWRLRYWGATDRAELSGKDLDALRAIGYAE